MPHDLSFEVQEGKNKGKVINIPQQGGSLGSSANAAIVLNENRIAKFHCSIAFDSAGICISDECGDGLKVNGRTVKKIPLRAGDVVQIGDCKLFVRGSIAAPDSETIASTESKSEHEIQLQPVVPAAATPSIPFSLSNSTRNASSNSPPTNSPHSANSVAVQRRKPSMDEKAKNDVRFALGCMFVPVAILAILFIIGSMIGPVKVNDGHAEWEHRVREENIKLNEEARKIQAQSDYLNGK